MSQELIQASLEQLRKPSLCVAVLPVKDAHGSYGDSLVLDLEKLTHSKRSLLIEKAFQTPDQDNEALYAKIRERLDRSLTPVLADVLPAGSEGHHPNLVFLAPTCTCSGRALL